MTNFFVTLFRLKMHMILFLDRLLDVVYRAYYCVARVTCLVVILQELLRNVGNNKKRTVFFMPTEKLRACSCMCVHLRKRSSHIPIFHRSPRQRHCYAIID